MSFLQDTNWSAGENFEGKDGLDADMQWWKVSFYPVRAFYPSSVAADFRLNGCVVRLHNLDGNDFNCRLQLNWCKNTNMGPVLFQLAISIG